MADSFSIAPVDKLSRSHFALLAGLALLPGVLSCVFLGRIHPDEIFQTLEPAFGRVHGYGVVAWEWVDGLRNWAIPLVFACILKLCALCGIDHPQAYRAAVQLPLYLLHLCMLVSVFRWMSRRIPISHAFAMTVLLALSATVVIYAGHPLSESISTAFIVLGFERLDRSATSKRQGLVAGLLLGFSIIARYASGVIVIGALAWLLFHRRWPVFKGCIIGLLTMASLLGILDFVTWGRPFHSLLRYIEYNVLSNASAEQFGREPAFFYVPLLILTLPLWAWFGIGVSAASGIRRRGHASSPRVGLPLLSAGLYLLSISITPHKEARFLYPVWILGMLAGAPALGMLIARIRLRAMPGFVYLLALTAGVASLPYEYDLHSDRLRAIVASTRGQDVRGLVVIGTNLWGTGGYFYIGKDVRLLAFTSPDDPALEQALNDPTVNRLVTNQVGDANLVSHDFAKVRVVGRYTIYVR